MKKVFFITAVLFIIFFISCSEKEHPTIPPTNIEKSVVLIYPNGGESYFIGDTLTVSWNSENIDSLNIFLSKNKGAEWAKIGENINANENQFKFISLSDTSSEALVKISCSNDSTVFDISDSTFTISEKYENINYFPLAVGNIFVYEVDESICPRWQEKHFIEKTEIVEKSELNNKEYFKFYTTRYDNKTKQKKVEYFYFDSSSGMIYQYNDYNQDSDYWIANLYFSEGTYEWTSGASVVVSITEENVLDELRSVRKNDYYGPYSYWQYFFSNGLGISYYSLTDECNRIKKKLKGAVIDGVVYGDTITIIDHSLPPDTLRYYPLVVNDYYIFIDTLQAWGHDDIVRKIKKEIVQQVQSGNLIIYKIVETSSDNSIPQRTYYERVAEDGKIYRYEGGDTTIIDDLSTKLNEFNYYYRFGYVEDWNGSNYFKSYSNVTINSETYLSRNYFTPGGREYDVRYSLLFDYGLYQYMINRSSSARKGRLIGGRKGGILWGDYQFP